MVGGLGIVIILAAAGYRVGWESVIFLLVFVALWRVAGDEWLHHA